MSTIDEIKSRIDIVDLVSETVQLRRSGKNYTGFCPFHPNVRTPAFAVFPETGTWRCFGQCNEGGDIFGFVMKKEGWDFVEALRRLAERAGVQLQPLTPEEEEKKEEHEHLRILLEDAVTFYRHCLLNTAGGEKALAYLYEERGLSDDTIEGFGLGYAPDSWEATLQYFKNKGFEGEDLLSAGLVSERDSGGFYDRFRHRVMIPIRDARGGMTGFGARAMDPDDVPKYLNSPQTALFDKGNLLYGLDRASKSIRTEDQVVIVEGYFDVISLHQAGFQNVVSSMGTALTEHHLRLLKRRSRRIVLALDSDAAGVNATMRGLQIARQAMDREEEPVFDARGLLRHESRLKADIRVTTLPEGMDPDEVIHKYPEEWQRLVETAKPIVAHVMDTLAANRDLEDPKAKQEVASQVLPLINDLPSAIERDTYQQRLSRLLQVDIRSLIVDAQSRLPRRRRQPAMPREEETRREPVSVPSSLAMETYCVGVLIRHPSLLYRIDRALLESDLARLTPDDFQHTEHRLIVELIQESLAQDQMEPLQYLLDHLPLDLMGPADNILASSEKVDANLEHVLDDLLLNLIHIRRRNLDNRLNEIRYLIEELQQSGALKDRSYHEVLNKHLQARALLDQALQCHEHRAVLNSWHKR
ncbi:MAG: DNA primase [Chloroflexota bacterium]